MDVLVISRSEDKLKEQCAELSAAHGTKVHYLAYDFTDAGQARDQFYDKLKEEIKKMVRIRINIRCLFVYV